MPVVVCVVACADVRSSCLAPIDSGVNQLKECREYALAYKARIESPDYAMPESEKANPVL